MEQKSQHILIRCIAILLFVFVLAPSVVKLAHVFENHKHEVCINPSDSHFHEVEIDCEFYKFKLNNTFTLEFNGYNWFYSQNHNKNFYSKYTFLKRFKNFGIALRGPPKKATSSC